MKTLVLVSCQTNHVIIYKNRMKGFHSTRFHISAWLATYSHHRINRTLFDFVRQLPSKHFSYEL